MPVPETAVLPTSSSDPQPVPDADWASTYARRVAWTDALVIVWAVIGSQIVWFGSFDSTLDVGRYRGGFALSYTLFSLVFIVAWALVLTLAASRDSRVIGIGSTEYRRVIDATFKLFGLVAIVAFLLQLDLARGFIITAFPVGLVGLLISRWIWRQWLSDQRKRGRFVARALLVGSRASASAIARELARQPTAGYKVVAACVPDGRGRTLDGGPIPIAGNLDHLHGAVAAFRVDTVIVTSSDDLPPDRIRELSWSLEPGQQHLVLAPSLTDIGGPRIHTRPVAGLPLIHVETPRYEGAKHYYKRAFDFIASLGLILVLSPLLLLLAITVKLSSPGPLLFRQERVGLNGRRFHMLKFRSMVVDAEERLAELRALQGAEGNEVMFKLADDPRITPIGKVLRRYSLDELPQLFNVLSGGMSLVGPRPPLDREVAVYENHVHRRFLVRPGITGLWQVSGRSSLSWEDTVRLDLYYVENWSITGDLVILWRTVRAVLARDGAF